MPSHPPALLIDQPAWLESAFDWGRAYHGEDRMRLAIELSRHNVTHGTGGPFGAAVFESASGRLVAVGVNSVVRLNNSALHAEMVALMYAQVRRGSFTLAGEGLPEHELVSSCEPCAMCLGATHWSGVHRLVYGATRDDATALEFDEGPVFPESWAYLESRGVAVQGEVLRRDAKAVLELYRREGGTIYNA